MKTWMGNVNLCFIFLFLLQCKNSVRFWHHIFPQNKKALLTFLRVILSPNSFYFYWKWFESEWSVSSLINEGTDNEISIENSCSFSELNGRGLELGDLKVLSGMLLCSSQSWITAPFKQLTLQIGKKDKMWKCWESYHHSLVVYETVRDKEPLAHKRYVHDWYMGLCPGGLRGMLPSPAEETWFRNKLRVLRSLWSL